MKPLTVDKQYHAERIVKGTAELRKSITLYRKSDPGYALFRITATNRIHDIILAKVLGGKPNKVVREWLEFWEKDALGGIGEDITELNRIINEEY